MMRPIGLVLTLLIPDRLPSLIVLVRLLDSPCGGWLVGGRVPPAKIKRTVPQ